MRFGPRKITALALFTLGVFASVQFAAGKKKEKANPAETQMDDQKRAVHVLNRLTFGPRPGDVQRLMSLGVDKWIDLQLQPEKIDDGALETRLAPFRTLRMDTREIVQNFPPPEVIRQVMNGKQSLPSDPTKRAIYKAQIERLQEQEQRKQQDAANPPPAAAATSTGDASADSSTPKAAANDDEPARHREDRMYAELAGDQLLDVPPDQRMKEVLKMSPDEQRMLTSSLKGPKADEFTEGMSPKQKETLLSLNNPQQVVANELMQAKVLRTIYSERQLDEVMTDFWFNHFNVFVGKGPDRYFITSYERDVIRPHALGKFEDLLVATAHSPAMLFYLDNWMSVGPNSEVARGIPPRPMRPMYRRYPYPPPPRPQAAKGKRPTGLNENYGRELMELHTLGVNGGYTQKDVTEVARVFTGWTIERPRLGGGFKFEERMHDRGDKLVLGHRIKDNGEKEGRDVLRLLAHHPSTAKFVCTKLAMRFVSDNPSPALVDRMSQTFLKKDGDIREVLRTMFHSPEFWAPEAYRAKVKTPLEFVASAARATGANVTDAMPLVRQLNNLGMPLYGMQPPTGYSMKADAWVNSSALLGRMNFSLSLASGKMKGVEVDAAQVLGTGNAPTDSLQVLAALENSFLGGDISKQTHDTITRQLNDPQLAQRKLDDPARPPNVGAIAGLILGSPEFQRR